MRYWMTALLAATAMPAAAATYELKATPQTVAWGHYDATDTPVLTIRSGDTVVIHTLLTNSPAGLEKAGVAPADVEPALRAVYDGVPASARGPGGHILTGPIAIEGAEPGDMLEVRIRKASDVLHVSASAIDRQILKAEEELGAQLFERLPGRLRLTAAGELLLVDVRGWEKAYARTLERFDELKGLRRGHVEIAMIDALSEGVVPEAVAALVQEYPGITFNLSTARNQRVMEMVTSADVDIGLLLDPVSSVDLEVRAFADIPLGIAMPVGHPLSTRTELQLSETLEHRLLLPAAPLIVGEHAKVLYQRQHIDVKRLTHCNDVRTLRGLVRAGAGVGLMSWLDAAPDVADGRLAFVPFRRHLTKPMTLALCVAPQRQLSRSALLTIQALAAKIDAMVVPVVG